MVIIITMAGSGSRFKKAGYHVPKYKIEARGKTLFEWSLESLLGFRETVSQYIFITRKEDHASDFIKMKCQNYNIENCEVVELEEPTDGQATTCMCGISHCSEDDPVFIYNIDTYVEPYEMSEEKIEGDGFIPCFEAEGDHWSFVATDSTGKAICVREKERISDHCSVGAYFFKSAELYKKLYEEYYLEGKHLEKNERYIAPLYNLMIEKNMDVRIQKLNKEKVHVLGTPEELKLFLL